MGARDRAWMGPRDRAWMGPRDRAWMGPRDRAWMGPRDRAWMGPRATVVWHPAKCRLPDHRSPRRLAARGRGKSERWFGAAWVREAGRGSGPGADLLGPSACGVAGKQRWF